MAEFSSEIGAFIQQKRDRNQRLTLENRQKLADVAGQLSQQTQQKIGWKQSAEQLNALGSQNLTDWIPVSWTDVASRGVDPIVQDINFRVQQSTAQLQGQPTTTVDDSGKTRDKTPAEITVGSQITAGRNQLNDYFTNNFGRYMSTPEGQEVAEMIKGATLAEISNIKQEAVIKMEVAKRREDYKKKWIDTFVENGRDTSELQAQTTIEGVRSVVAPQMQADIKREADAKLAKTKNTADNKTINANLKEITGSDKMVKIISSLKLSKAFEDWFDENGNIKDDVLRDNRKFGYIRELATKFDTEVKARVSESGLREEAAKVASGKVNAVEEPIIATYKTKPDKAYELINNMKLLARGLKHQEEYHGLKTDASALYVDSKNDIVDFYGKIVTGISNSDTKMIIGQIKANPDYLADIDTATAEYEKVDAITADLTNIAFDIVQGNPLIKFQKPEVKEEVTPTDITETDVLGDILNKTGLTKVDRDTDF